MRFKKKLFTKIETLIVDRKHNYAYKKGVFEANMANWSESLGEFEVCSDFGKHVEQQLFFHAQFVNLLLQQHVFL